MRGAARFLAGTMQLNCTLTKDEHRWTRIKSEGRNPRAEMLAENIEFNKQEPTERTEENGSLRRLACLFKRRFRVGLQPLAHRDRNRNIFYGVTLCYLLLLCVI